MPLRAETSEARWRLCEVLLMCILFRILLSALLSLLILLNPFDPFSVSYYGLLGRHQVQHRQQWSRPRRRIGSNRPRSRFVGLLTSFWRLCHLHVSKTCGRSGALQCKKSSSIASRCKTRMYKESLDDAAIMKM